MADFKISQDLAQRILDYLVERPFREVHALVGDLRAIEIIPGCFNNPPPPIEDEPE
jgi:hypothetical protein